MEMLLTPFGDAWRNLTLFPPGASIYVYGSDGVRGGRRH
jgi:hypothetical protein